MSKSQQQEHRGNMNKELIERIEVAILDGQDEIVFLHEHDFDCHEIFKMIAVLQDCKAALSQREAEPVASTESTLAFFCKYDFDNVAKVDDGRAAVFLSREQWEEIRRAAIGKPVASSQDAEGFIAECGDFIHMSPDPESSGWHIVAVSDLRAWMAGHVRAKLPCAMEMEPFQTVDKASKNYKAGWNACRASLLTASKERTE